MELHGERVVLQPLAEEHIEGLVAIGREPDVRRWWTDVNADHLRGKLTRTEDVTPFAVLVEGRLAGLIEYHEENEAEFRSAGIDIFLGEAFQNRGLGTDAMRTLARHLFEERGHHRLTIDPAADNVRAVRCYEKIGFRRVGIMREYWTDPAGRRHDGVLLDLLAAELA